MKNKNLKKYLYALLILPMLLVLSFAAIQPGKKDSSQTKQMVKTITYYTCSMHHQIHEDKPGKCPICGMTLVKVTKTISIKPKQKEMNGMKMKPKQQRKPASKKETSKMKGMTQTQMKNMKGMTKKQMSGMKMLTVSQPIKLSKRQILLGNVRTSKVSYGKLTQKLTLTGKTSFSQSKTTNISAQFSGWITKMYVNNLGEKVVKGQLLYTVYSPELLSAEKDFLTATKNNSASGTDLISRALRNKLSQWGLSQKQINALKNQSKIGDIPVCSNKSGYVTLLNKREGDKIKAGESVMQLSQSNELWVEAKLYNQYLSRLDDISKIIVRPMANPSIKLIGHLVFENPLNQQNSAVHLLNIKIDNPKKLLQSGVPVYVELITKSRLPSTLVPKSALILAGNKNYVWVKTNQNQFVRHQVEINQSGEKMVQILKGINKTAKIVCSGANLLNSEYILEYGSGVNLSGMQMSDMKMSGRSK